MPFPVPGQYGNRRSSGSNAIPRTGSCSSQANACWDLCTTGLIMGDPSLSCARGLKEREPKRRRTGGKICQNPLCRHPIICARLGAIAATPPCLMLSGTCPPTPDEEEEDKDLFKIQYIQVGTSAWCCDILHRCCHQNAVSAATPFGKTVELDADLQKALTWVRENSAEEVAHPPCQTFLPCFARNAKGPGEEGKRHFPD